MRIFSIVFSFIVGVYTERNYHDKVVQFQELSGQYIERHVKDFLNR